MMVNVDEAFYIGDFLGGSSTAAVPLAEFSRYAALAAQEIKATTFGRPVTAEDEQAVKMCCCALAEAIYSAAVKQQESAGKASEKVGGYSVSYEGRTQQQAALADEKRRILRLWLGGTGLLYAGVG